ncbi:MAG: hypothetical protein K6G04_00245, partial [Lachnospiraceae bacterium]|nr:hypothetical protein [Lachnospiraceae bacterium]
MSNKLKKTAVTVASVGMATLMATTPLTAMAQEAPAPEPEAKLEPKTEEVAQEPKEKAVKEEASQAVVAADNAYEATKDANDTTMDVVKTTAEHIGQKLPDSVDVNYGEQELLNVKSDIQTMEESNATADQAEAENANLVSDAGDAAVDTKDEVEKQESIVNDNAAALDGATTIDAANGAYDNAQAAATSAEKTFTENLTDYNNLLAQVEENNQKIADAQATFDTAAKSAGKNLTEAENILAESKEQATMLQTMLDAKAEEIAKSGAAEIIAAQEKRDASGEDTNWPKCDQVFYEIIKNYYMPQVVGVKNFTVDQNGFTRPGTIGNIKGSNTNYYKVTYVKNGETKEL